MAKPVPRIHDRATRNRLAASRERQERARTLHLEGKTWQAVSEALGYSDAAAAYQAAAAATAREPIPNRIERIQEEDDRISWAIAHAVDILYQHHYIIEGRDAVVVRHPDTGEYLDDVRPKIEALKLIQALARDRRRMLGLDAPSRKQVEIISDDKIADEIARLEAEMADNDRLAEMAKQLHSIEPE